MPNQRADMARTASPTYLQDNVQATSPQSSTHVAPVTQRAIACPTAMTPTDVLALQRTVGNRATAQLLAPVLPQPQASAGPTIQRKKDEEERGKKHRRMAHARKTIGLLGNNLKPKLDKHIFNALPADGKELDQNDPVGLHAYNDGKLPKEIVGEVTEGTENQVHTLTWHWKGKEKTKWSTMFPVWMPPKHVRTLIALDFPDTRENGVEDKELSKEDTKTYIQRGHKFSLKKSGETVYPVADGG